LTPHKTEQAIPFPSSQRFGLLNALFVKTDEMVDKACIIVAGKAFEAVGRNSWSMGLERDSPCRLEILLVLEIF
jgi:hypothetical protein